MPDRCQKLIIVTIMKRGKLTIKNVVNKGLHGWLLQLAEYYCSGAGYDEITKNIEKRCFILLVVGDRFRNSLAWMFVTHLNVSGL